LTSADFALGRSTLGAVVGYLREHLAEDVTLDDLAAQANLSKYHLLRMFKKSTGDTPHQYLVGLRLGRAAKLLRHSQLPVARIAAECGYRSAGQFAAMFRRAYGMTPKDYRGTAG
jgi:AraC family transcriptional regulator